MKGDHSLTRIKAFVKRLGQICLVSETNFICAVLLLLSGVFQAQPSLNALLTQPVDACEDEDYQDMPDSDDETTAKAPRPNSGDSTATGYDPLKRNPRYSKADASCFFEISLLKNHFHPTIRSVPYPHLPLPTKRIL